jgi:carboxyl-terminal processing protease
LVASRTRQFRAPVLTIFLTVSATCAAAGCGGQRASPAAPTGISPVAQAYLTELIAVMEAHSINRLKIDWTSFRTGVLSAAGTAQIVESTFPAIQVALNLLGDGHSSYQPARGGLRLGAPRRGSCRGQDVGTPAIPADVAYVRVGGFSGSAGEATAFANVLQQTIANADRGTLAGWIVDVRGNTGGNMWPMIAGVGPVLGEGRAGYFIDPVGVEIPFEYRNGASWENGSLAQRVDVPYRLRRESPRVAVLFDGATASSGEAVVVAFQRRADTRSFGAVTCGLSTANEAYTMSDGASLLLTVAVMADRTKFQYGNSIEPDEDLTDPRATEQRAVEWLRTGR